MSRFAPRKEAEAATELVKVRVTPAEKLRLREDAQLCALTVSEFLRRKAFGRSIVPQAERAMFNELRVAILDLRDALTGVAADKVGADYLRAAVEKLTQCARRALERQ